MNYFLIDYENVTDVIGLRGAKHLGSDDCLIIFYSKAHKMIRRDVWNEIVQSRCLLKMYKLVNIRKNALDFYIAAEAASLFERGERQIALVSMDKDLNSVADFLNLKEISKDVHIIKSPSLEGAISQMKDYAGKNRRTSIIEETTKINLDDEYAAYKKYQKLKADIRELFESHETSDNLEKITEIATSSQNITKRDLFNKCRHEFGSIKGTAIYNVLKTVL